MGLRIIWNNLADTGTLTALSEDSSFPKENVQNEFKTKTWRSTGITDEWLKWDLGSSQNVTCVAVVNHNFDAGGTYVFEGNDTDDWASPAVSETLTYDDGIVLKYFTGGSYRYWRLKMTNTSGTYVSVGRVMFGPYTEPSQNYSASWRQRDVDWSAFSRSMGGQAHMDKRETYKSLTLNFEAAPLTDKQLIETMFDTVGISHRVVISLDPTNYLNDRSYYGRFPESPVFSHTISEQYDYSLTFEEDL